MNEGMFLACGFGLVSVVMLLAAFHRWRHQRQEQRAYAEQRAASLQVSRAMRDATLLTGQTPRASVTRPRTTATKDKYTGESDFGWTPVFPVHPTDFYMPSSMLSASMPVPEPAFGGFSGGESGGAGASGGWDPAPSCDAGSSYDAGSSFDAGSPCDASSSGGGVD